MCVKAHIGITGKEAVYAMAKAKYLGNNPYIVSEGGVHTL